MQTQKEKIEINGCTDKTNHHNEYRLMAIETSCDDTALSIIKCKKGENNFEIIQNLNYSQIAIHNKYGGVYPHMAKMEHLKNLPIILLASFDIKLNNIEEENLINKLNIKNSTDLYIFFDSLSEILNKNNYDKFISEISKIEYIAVTCGPGLAPSLWTGIEFAKLISIKYNKKIYPINHMEGHVFSALIKNNSDSIYFDTNKTIETVYDSLALLISGGHTEIIHCKNKTKTINQKNIKSEFNNDLNNNLYTKKYCNFEYKKIGETLDDAVGECYDKISRALNLPYPGGPEISRLGEEAKVLNLKLEEQNLILPRPLINSKDYNFSFSGLKTAVIHRINKYKNILQISDNNPNTNGSLFPDNDLDYNSQTLKAFCREFELSISDTIKKKIIKAIDQYQIQNLIVGGGVSANTNIRNVLKDICEDKKIKLFLPDKGLSMDNALMIAAAAINKINNEINPIIDIDKIQSIKAVSRWSIEQEYI